MKKTKAAAVCTNYRLIDAKGKLIKNTDAYRVPAFVKQAVKNVTPISFHRLVFGNLVQGCTYCFTKKVREIYLKVHSNHLIHDHQIMFIASLVGKCLFYNEKLIDYRIHEKNAIGLDKKIKKNRLELKMPSKKPFMVSFIEELDAVFPVPNKTYYKVLYYLRIPYILSKTRR